MRTESLLRAVTLSATMLYCASAAAQTSASQEIEIYGGEMSGDRLTEAAISGARPRLDDTATFGARYTYNFTDMWGIQLGGGYSPSRASHVFSGDSNLGLTTLDADVVWNFTPGYRIVGYTTAGVGYAWANLDRAIMGAVSARPVAILDSNSFTANAGIGGKYYVTSNLFIDVGARFRYLNRIVSSYQQGMNTAETTIGVGWRF